ncbi:hypothetical protein ColTof4_01421 [Colletotrichum tofieldiae]|nr:hypothetical protein ColTof3_08678 [Colletotrichum tofieldiae]GKT68998.1 hypothetical protein ColTof4_01421 [Colletotrichum tofieldiae]
MPALRSFTQLIDEQKRATSRRARDTNDNGRGGSGQSSGSMSDGKLINRRLRARQVGRFRQHLLATNPDSLKLGVIDEIDNGHRYLAYLGWNDPSSASSSDEEKWMPSWEDSPNGVGTFETWFKVTFGGWRKKWVADGAPSPEAPSEADGNGSGNGNTHISSNADYDTNGGSGGGGTGPEIPVRPETLGLDESRTSDGGEAVRKVTNAPGEMPKEMRWAALDKGKQSEAKSTVELELEPSIAESHAIPSTTLGQKLPQTTEPVAPHLRLPIRQSANIEALKTQLASNGVMLDGGPAMARSKDRDTSAGSDLVSRDRPSPSLMTATVVPEDRISGSTHIESHPLAASQRTTLAPTAVVPLRPAEHVTPQPWSVPSGFAIEAGRGATAGTATASTLSHEDRQALYEFYKNVYRPSRRRN